jgi:uncharacterized protein (TIGR02118 family)
MMKLIALWTAPDDPDGFDADYLATHAKLCRELPGLVSFSSGRCVSGPYYRTADLAFESGETLGAGLGGPEGAALLADTERLQSTFGNKVETLIVNTD